VPAARIAVALGASPIQPLARGDRLAGPRIVAESAPVPLRLVGLVGHGTLDDQDERIQLATLGPVPPLDEAVRAPLGTACEVEEGPMHGDPGYAPRMMSSMLGWVAAVSATESPSQLKPPFIQRMCRTLPSSSMGGTVTSRHNPISRDAWRQPIGRNGRLGGTEPIPRAGKRK
jgi:hypothetical protein